jgi:hypothetical protein
MLTLISSCIENGSIPITLKNGNSVQIGLVRNSDFRGPSSLCLHNILTTAFADASYVNAPNTSRFGSLEKFLTKIKNFNQLIADRGSSLDPDQMSNLQKLQGDWKILYTTHVAGISKLRGVWCPCLKKPHESVYSPVSKQFMLNVIGQFSSLRQNLPQPTGQEDPLLEQLGKLEQACNGIKLEGGGYPKVIWEALVGKGPSAMAGAPEAKTGKVADFCLGYMPEEAKKTIEEDTFRIRFEQMRFALAGCDGTPPQLIAAEGGYHAYNLMPFQSPELGKALLDPNMSATDFLEKKVRKNPGKIYPFIDSNYGTAFRTMSYGIVCAEDGSFKIVDAFNGREISEEERKFLCTDLECGRIILD